MIQNIDLTNYRTYILYSDTRDGLYPSYEIFPSEDLFPISVEELDTIVSGTMKLDEIIADSEIRFGQLYSTKFEVQVYDSPDISGKYIQVLQADGTTVRNVFTGRVVSCKLDNSGYDRTLVAYDMSYEYRNKNVAEWWNTFWAQHPDSTVHDCRESLLDYMGIYHEDVVLPNDDVIIHKNVTVAIENPVNETNETGTQQEYSQNQSAMNFGNVISQLCEISACFPHINRDDYMEFIMLNTRATPKDLTYNFEGLNSTFEDYVTDEITGLEFYDSEGELKYVVGDITNTYKISSNIFLYDMGTAKLQQVGNTILDYISELSFTPATVKMIVGDLDLNLGDKVHTPKGDFYILENSYSSSQLVEQTISAKGEKTLGESNRSLTDTLLILNEKWSRLTFNVEKFETEFGEYRTDVDGRITNMSTRITQNSESITSEATRREEADGRLVADYSSRIQQTANSIRFTVTEGLPDPDPVTGETSFSSIISLEPEAIEINSTGKLIIDTDNFKLTEDGTVETNNARLHGEIYCGEEGYGSIHIYDNIIEGNGDSYFDFAGEVIQGRYTDEGIHANTGQFVFSTSAIGVTRNRGDQSVLYGHTGSITWHYLDHLENDDTVWVWATKTLNFVHGLLID